MNDAQGVGLSLEDAIIILRRRWRYVIGCFLLFAVAAYGYSQVRAKEYTATATILFQSQTAAAEASGLNALQNNNPTGQQQTNVDLVKLGSVANDTASRLHNGLSPTQILSAVTTAPVGESNLVSVSATTTSAHRASQIANTFAAAFISSYNQSNQASIGSAILLVQAQYGQLTRTERAAPQGQDLLDRIETLRIYKSLQNDAQLAQLAKPPLSPSSPKLTRDVALGAILGLVIGLIAAFLFERLDQTVRDQDQIEQILDVPVLGVIPHFPARANAATTAQLRIESSGLIRATLRYFAVQRPLRTVMVVSAVPGEGKTTVAENLARASVAGGSKTLLIEADLRRPVLAGRLGVNSGPGLSEALLVRNPTEGAPADAGDFIQHVSVASPEYSGDHPRQLDVLVAGAQPPNPGEMLASDRMAAILQWAGSEFDFVVIDTSPATLVADPLTLTHHVDGVLMIARFGTSDRRTLRQLFSQLRNIHAHVLGVVLNDMSGASTARYGYDELPHPDGQAKRSETLPSRSVLTSTD